MTAWIVEYRYYNRLVNAWESKISQEGYSSLEAAQKFIEGRTGNLTRCTPMRYQADGQAEYYIYDIHIREPRETAGPTPFHPYERARSAVYATGNKWAIENFDATHG